MLNRLDPDQARLFVRPDLGPNCLQRLSADDTNTNRQRVTWNTVIISVFFYRLRKTHRL